MPLGAVAKKREEDCIYVSKFIVVPKLRNPDVASRHPGHQIQKEEYSH